MCPKRRDSPETLSELERILGHDFADRGLLEVALTHASVPRHEDNYERLEFLGDRVLGLVIADQLYRAHPGETEGDLAKRLTMLVQQSALVAVAKEIRLAPFLRLSAGEAKAGGVPRDTILSDCLEAVIGAIYLDGGFEPARRFIETHWRPLLASHAAPPEDPKTRLQEVAQSRGLKLPEYRLLAKTGVDHQPVFDVEVVVGGMGRASASARSKRAAEKLAAQRLLAEIGEGPAPGGAEQVGDA
jgi:ribonuclease-3